MITSFAIGALAGAALACYYVESEYQSIMTKLQSDHSTILLQSQSNYNKCQTNLLEGRTQSYVKTITKLKLQADQNERTFQHSVQHYLDESIQSYNVTNEALVMVSTRFKAEVEKYELMITKTQTSLSECRKNLENKDGVEQYESMIKNTQISLTTCQEYLELSVKQYNNCRITLEDMIREDTDRTDEYKARDDELQSLRTEAEKDNLMIKNTQSLLTECQQSLENMIGLEHFDLMMNHTQSSLTKCRVQLENMIKEDADRTEEYKARDDELQSLEEELERRDIERAECDALYRDLITTRMQNEGK